MEKIIRMNNMIQRFRNSWISFSDLVVLLNQLHRAVKNISWLDTHQPTKYIEIRIDMRTGHAIIKDSTGEILQDTDIQILFGIPVNPETKEYNESN